MHCYLKIGALLLLSFYCYASQVKFSPIFSNALQDRLFTNKRDVAISIFWVMHTLKMFVQVHSRYYILLLKSPLFMKLTTTKFKRKHLILQSKLGLHTFEQVPLRGVLLGVHPQRSQWWQCAKIQESELWKIMSNWNDEVHSRIVLNICQSGVIQGKVKHKISCKNYWETSV